VNAADLARAALAYARRGLRVHPCRPKSKLPLLDDWPHRATLDPTTIESWWRRYPKANVAITTGGTFRLLVIDIDPDAGGEASLTRLEQEHGALPATVEVVTPRGGSHLYLIVPTGRPMPGNSVGKLGDGIDTRGQGGYVLTPPSIVNGRAYHGQWIVAIGQRRRPIGSSPCSRPTPAGPVGQPHLRSGASSSMASRLAHATTRSRASPACCSDACPILW
jgi:hypothetical protein